MPFSERLIGAVRRLVFPAAFFVEPGALPACGLPKLSPEEIFHPSRFIGAAGAIGHPRGDGPAIAV